MLIPLKGCIVRIKTLNQCVPTGMLFWELTHDQTDSSIGYGIWNKAELRVYERSEAVTRVYDADTKITLSVQGTQSLSETYCLGITSIQLNREVEKWVTDKYITVRNYWEVHFCRLYTKPPPLSQHSPIRCNVGIGRDGSLLAFAFL